MALTHQLYHTDIKIGEDAQTKIDFETANEIHFDADNAERVKIDSTGLTVVSGSLETATIDYTDGDNAITIADGGAVTFSQNATFSGIIDITDATDASDNSGDTGALRTEGGASIAKKLYVGTDLDVDGTAELDNITIAGAQGSDGQVITSTGSGVGWEAIPAGGISRAEQWRLNTGLSSNAQDGILIENWEIDDTAGYGRISAGMSLSTGVFTFPETGIWQIIVKGIFSTPGGLRLWTTQDDGSNWVGVANSGTGEVYTSPMTHGLASLYHLNDVDNTSNDKIKVTMGTYYSSGTLNGSTSANNTTIMFVRLGDT